MLATVTSRLDYCNSVLIEVSTTEPLQRLQNAAVRTHLRTKSPWTRLAVSASVTLTVAGSRRLQSKLSTLMYAGHNGQCPAYLSAAVKSVAMATTRQGLRSAATINYIPRLQMKFSERGFSYRSPGTVHQNTSVISHHLLLFSDNLKHFYFPRTILIFATFNFLWHLQCTCVIKFCNKRTTNFLDDDDNAEALKRLNRGICLISVNGTSLWHGGRRRHCRLCS